LKLELYKHAAMAIDLPAYRLCKGDLVTLVDKLQAPDGKPGYAVEVFNALGETIDVYMIDATALEPLRDDEVLCIRRLEKAA